MWLYINPSFAEHSCGNSHQTEMGPDAAAQECITLLRGLVGLIAFLVTSVLQAAHMQDSHDILTSSYGLDSKGHGREHVLAQRGREVGSALASGERAQGVRSFREAGFTKSSAMSMPGQPSHGLLVDTRGQGAGIPSSHSGLLWSHSWNLGQCKDLIRQPLDVRFDFRGIWSSRQKMAITYCILAIKLLSIFCLPVN